MKPSSGSIPSEIAIIMTKPIKVSVGCPWDISWSSGDDDEDDEDDADESVKIEVTPSFITDAASTKSIATGKLWAARGVSDKNFSPTVEIRKNVPIKNVVLCSLESRGNGGRAYKVIADGVYVDMREDVIIDAMLQEGVKKGGILGGEYIWVKLGAQSRLIRVGSTLHDKVKLIVHRKQLKEIPAKDFVPGTIYATKKDERALYLGSINTVSLEHVRSELEFKSIPIKNHLMFVRIPEYGEKNIRKFILAASNKDQWGNIISWCSIIREKDHRYVAAVGTMDPHGLIEMLRDKARSQIKEAFTFLSSGKNKQGWQYQRDSLGYDIARNSGVANMYVVNGPVVEPFDYEPLLNFI